MHIGRPSFLHSPLLLLLFREEELPERFLPLALDLEEVLPRGVVELVDAESTVSNVEPVMSASSCCGCCFPLKPEEFTVMRSSFSRPSMVCTLTNSPTFLQHEHENFQSTQITQKGRPVNTHGTLCSESQSAALALKQQTSWFW